jgi:hypothetical protein
VAVLHHQRQTVDESTSAYLLKKPIGAYAPISRVIPNISDRIVRLTQIYAPNFPCHIVPSSRSNLCRDHAPRDAFVCARVAIIHQLRICHVLTRTATTTMLALMPARRQLWNSRHSFTFLILFELRLLPHYIFASCMLPCLSAELSLIHQRLGLTNIPVPLSLLPNATPALSNSRHPQCLPLRAMLPPALHVSFLSAQSCHLARTNQNL